MSFNTFFLFSYLEKRIATIIGVKFIKINNTDEPVVLPSEYKINIICPKIKVANKVITEYNIAILLLLHIFHPPLLSTDRAKPELFDKTNAGNPHKYRLSAFLSVIQTRKVWV
jgi:hypothetical protein